MRKKCIKNRPTMRPTDEQLDNHIPSYFLVACTRLYKPLCRLVSWSVGRFVRWSVGPSVRRSVAAHGTRDLWRSALLVLQLGKCTRWADLYNEVESECVLCKFRENRLWSSICHRRPKWNKNSFFCYCISNILYVQIYWVFTPEKKVSSRFFTQGSL